jgi:hypothetical protein
MVCVTYAEDVLCLNDYGGLEAVSQCLPPVTYRAPVQSNCPWCLEAATDPIACDSSGGWSLFHAFADRWLGRVIYSRCRLRQVSYEHLTPL